MHALLVTLGTDGDVFPYFGIAARLKARGHQVTLTTSENYRALAGEHGVGFHPLLTEAQTHAFLSHPDVWHPLKCALHGIRWGVPFIRPQYQMLAELARDRDVVVVASPGVLAARLLPDKLHRRLATVILQPWTLPSVYEPPVLPIVRLPRWAPRPVGRLYFRLINAVGDLLVGHELNRVRASLGLKSVRCIFDWWLSPHRILGMFPEWYGAPQPDWPPQLRLAGFPLYDGRPNAGMPDDLLTFCKGGPAPIAFTLGTGMMHAAEFFREAVEACRLLGARGIFLTKYRHQLPDPLPPFIHHCSFAPFRELLPHCSVVVHHGGIGTASRAMSCGVPQLVLPLAWDQDDNAARLKRLGVGDWLRPRRRRARHLAAALAKLQSAQIQEKCRAVAGRFGEEDALDVAAKWIAELVR